DGRNVVTTRVADTNPTQLIRHIVGRDLADMFGSAASPGAASLLEVSALRVNGVGPIDVRLRAGEILGLVGLRGAGQDAVARALFGALADWSGKICFGGDAIRPREPAAAMRLGIAFVSGKRAEESIAASLTVRENVYPNPVVFGLPLLGWLAKGKERRRIAAAVQRFNIRPPDPERAVGTLSGGNQQKAVLARWLEADSRLLLLEEPTSGVDVGAKAEIYALLREHAARGRGVLLVSSDFEEIAGLCHRALVFRRGRVVAEAPSEQMTVAHLTQLATGAADAPREGA
ncbi:MAG TPA: ATP-binding cassette domain-containing protein, partial [Thermomicrobiales bacterium]|nr:ATP-binding cassette domain-containing protein [Thermomicrobiales bacterium]